jgi:hypothetical protein
MKRAPPIIMTTPGGMILNLSHYPPRPSQKAVDGTLTLNFRLLLQFRDREGHLRVPA